MKYFSRLGWLVFALLVALLSQNTVQAQGITTVDGQGGAYAGEYTSLVLDSNGNPVISHRYRESGNSYLRLVHCDDPYCTSASKSNVVNGDNYHTSLILDDNNYPIITYVNATTGDLMLVRCNDVNCQGGDDTPVFIAHIEKAGSINSYTGYNSVGLHSNGNPVISYQYHDYTNSDFTKRNNQLRMAFCNDPNCGSIRYVVVNRGGVDQSQWVGRYNSLAFNGDNPVISYYNASEYKLMISYCLDVICNTSNTFLVNIIGAPEAGKFTSLVLDANGNPVVSHFDRITGDLWLTTGANLHDPPNASFTSNVVQNIGTAGSDMTYVGYNSLVLNSSGNPVISYIRFIGSFTGRHTTLNLAYCDDPVCAPGGNSSVVLDDTVGYYPTGPTGSRQPGDAGRYNSLALDRNGLPVISYMAGWYPYDLRVYTPIVTVTANDRNAAENPVNNGQFTVDLGIPNTSGVPLIVSYTVAGTATVGVDHNLLTGSVTIPAGQQTATLDVIPFDDQIDDDGETVRVTLTGTNTSVGVSHTPAQVTITDVVTANTVTDDIPDILLNPTGISAVEGGSTEYLVRLNSRPVPGETITITVTDASGGAIASVTGSPVTLNENNWHIGATVTVQLNDDTLTNGNRTITDALTHSATSSTGFGPYENLVASTNVTLTVIDDETANIVIDPTAFSLYVQQRDSYEVSLSQEPSSDVTITISPGSGCTTDQTTLTFSPSGGTPPSGGTIWDMPQTVAITAGSNGDTTCTVSHTASGGGYDGVSGTPLTVFVQAQANDDGHSEADTTINPVNSAHGDADYITKVVDNVYPAAGDTVTYTLTAHNPKNIPLTEVVIYDVFDYRLERPTLVSTTHGTGTVVENTLTVSGFTLQPGETATIVVSAVISNTLQPGETIPNIAALESPDASIHVSNLLLLGRSTGGADGDLITTQINLSAANQLPNTGYAPEEPLND